MRYRQQKIEQVIDLLNNGRKEFFEIRDVDDYFYVLASNGLDFSVSEQNAKTFAKFADLLSVNSLCKDHPQRGSAQQQGRNQSKLCCRDIKPARNIHARLI